MEEVKEVKPMRVDYKCPNCETGYLRPTGMCYSTSPPQYPHICNNGCGYGGTFNKIYPYIDYKEVDVMELIHRMF
jgi:hypothetical protein